MIEFNKQIIPLGTILQGTLLIFLTVFTVYITYPVANGVLSMFVQGSTMYYISYLIYYLIIFFVTWVLPWVLLFGKPKEGMNNG